MNTWSENIVIQAKQVTKKQTCGLCQAIINEGSHATLVWVDIYVCLTCTQVIVEMATTIRENAEYGSPKLTLRKFVPLEEDK